MVMPARLAVAPGGTLKMRKGLLCCTGSTVSKPAPGPCRLMPPANPGSSEARVTDPVTPAAKSITSAPAPLFALIIACRSEPAPASARFVTVKVAPSASDRGRMSKARKLSRSAPKVFM